MVIKRMVIGVMLLLGGATWVLAEQPVGAVGSESAHAPGSVAETEENEHQPLHGGYFGDADDLYHYEVLLEQAGRQLVLYVRDEHNRPLDVRILEGKWALDPDSPKAVAGTFQPSATGDRFTTLLPPTNVNPIHVKVAVPKGGVWAEMEFYIPLPTEPQPAS